MTNTRRTRNSNDYVDVDDKLEELEYPPSPQEDVGRPNAEPRRRLDPVLDQREATKRGLDVNKLHASETPAWKNLRNRNASNDAAARGANQYYDEDDIVEDEGEEDVAEEDEQHQQDNADVDDTGGHRYSRRERQVVQRYEPEKPRSGKPRNSRGHGTLRGMDDDDDDDDDDESDGGRGRRNTEAFSQRYSVRDRKTVERFTYQAPGGGSGGNKSQRRSDRHGGAGFDDDEERKQYSFRDRSQCTIKPASQQQNHLHHSGSGDKYGDRKRPRLERYNSSRLGGRRGGGGSGYGGHEGDVLDLPSAAALGGGGYGSFTLPPPPNQQGYGSQPGMFMTPGRAQPQPQKPWDIALAAAKLPFPNGGGATAGGGASGAVAAHHGGGSAAGGGSTSLEITPIEVDPSLTFESVGGLAPYVRALKEMVFLPLTYPELFERFGISPPRGVLFYGPPGTGKTLVARALAAHASRATPGKKVSFYMRKGADVLSKWVGEAERHLRLLFEEARKNQPSIIFFDEIDGLAPVRSSKADQIHNSIVSTLLALMDGLDSRGQVVVIGATNRVDALDGALRRPGRFDRELAFPLPGQQARREILGIHTRKWSERPGEALLEELAAGTVGYCGADLRALCTEASLAALRRKYPQIYNAEQKLLIDPGEVKVEKKDFLSALTAITPASHRSAAAHARPLPPTVAPVLASHLATLLGTLEASFPPAAACIAGELGPGASSKKALSMTSVMRPRLLICGADGCGQGHLGPALLHALEGLQTQSVGLPSLLSDASARSPEEALVHAVAEARRAAPAILYLPHLQLWWDTAPSSLRATLWALLADLPSDLPLLLLATADVGVEELDPAALALFGGTARADSIYELPLPTPAQRLHFFEDISQTLVSPPSLDQDLNETSFQDPSTMQPLPLAPDALEAEAEAKQQAEHSAACKKYEEDQAVLRAFRMLLRDVVTRLLTNRKWEPFWQPVDPEEDPQYYEVVTKPMDLCTLLCRIDARKYMTPAAFLADLALITEAERQYWGEAPDGVKFISRACAMEDSARAAFETALIPELRARLETMAASGGPAPAPPELEEMHAAAAGNARGSKEEAEGDGLDGTAAADGYGRGGAGGRRGSRHRGEIDDKLMHADPEAERRRIGRLKKEQQQLLKEQQEQQQVEGDIGAAPAAGVSEEEQEQGAASIVEIEMAEAAEQTDNLQQVMNASGDDVCAVLTTSTKENLPSNAGGSGSGDVTTNKDVACEQIELGNTVPSTITPAEGAGIVTASVVVSEQDKARCKSLQRQLASCTDGLVLEQLEGLVCLLHKVVNDSKKEADRKKVIEGAVFTAENFVAAAKAFKN